MIYYVYVYLNPLKPGNYNFGKFNFEFEPFYIGKGSLFRIDEHIKECKRILKNNTQKTKDDKLNWPKINLIRKILKYKFEPIRIKIYSNISEESSLRLERYLINKIGRKNLNQGPLLNLTDGGEKIGSYWRGKKRPAFTIEHKNKLSLSHIGQVSWNKGKKMSASTIEKNRISSTGRKFSKEINNKKGRKGVDHKSSKIFICTDPNGIEHKVIGQFHKFCKDNGLKSIVCMMDVASGKRDNYKGWKCKCLGLYKNSSFAI